MRIAQALWLAGLSLCLAHGPLWARDWRILRPAPPPPAPVEWVQQASGALIPQSQAVAAALQYFPDAKPIGVQLLQSGQPVYAVKIRIQGQVLRVLVDAQTGQVIGN